MTARDARGRFTKADDPHGTDSIPGSPPTGTDEPMWVHLPGGGVVAAPPPPPPAGWDAPYDDVPVGHGPHPYEPFLTVDTGWCRVCVQDEHHPNHDQGDEPEVNVTINGEHVDAEVDITAEGVNVVLEINGDADQFRDMIRGWVGDASRWEDSAALLRGTARKSDPVIVHTDEATGWIVEGELDRIPTYRWALIVALVCAIGWAVTAYALVQQATNR